MELGENNSKPHRWIRILQVLFVPAVVAVGFILILSGYDWRETIQSQGVKGYAVYLLLVWTLPLIGFPISAFYIFCGAAFPPFVGLGLTSVGLMLNMTVGYWIGRYFLHRPLSVYLGKTKFNSALINQRNLLRMTILVRAVPGVPYFMQNYLLGMARVPVRTYLTISWMIQSLYCAGTIFLVYSGMSLRDPVNASIFAVVGILFVGSIWYSKKKLTQIRASDID